MAWLAPRCGRTPAASVRHAFIHQKSGSSPNPEESRPPIVPQFPTFLIGLILMHASVAIAEPVSDRIIVTIRGQGPDVVLIPGLATSGAVWDATVAHLQEHYCLHIVQMSASG